jgi:hypothetical protein
LLPFLHPFSRLLPRELAVLVRSSSLSCSDWVVTKSAKKYRYLCCHYGQ